VAKCAECGFLAVRHSETRKLEEAEKAFRERGTIPIVGMGRPYQRHESMPLCFMGSYDLRDECNKRAKKGNPNQKTILEVIQEERQCGSFTKWQLGFTPKEHKEMLDSEKMQKWHRIELIIIVGGNLLAGCLGALLVWLLTRAGS
jgi:hypothetical protein